MLKGESFYVKDEDYAARVEQGFILLKKASELIIKQKSGQEEIISIPTKTAEEMVALTDDHTNPETIWIEAYRYPDDSAS